ncbi:MAG: murB [Rickettsiaceae bacterium]|jgi:UDP-N-acetylmuramate dehydrogenase|nr:murB [Rickettsiaceae bacterium]
MFETASNLPKVRGTYRMNADLSKTNWFRVGGKAQVLFLPKDVDDLAFFLANKPQNLPVNILGVGSNIIIRDGGVEGVVIKLGGNFAKISHQDNLVTIGAGCLCYNAALYSKINGLSGIEFLSGVPGGIGGAIAMNAGCYGADVSGVLARATAVNPDGKIIMLENSDFGFKYRGNSLPKDLIFVEGVFRVETSSSEEVGKTMAELNKKREESQPIRSKTGGSTFKNPPGDKKAWQLIDEAGCRGMKVGDAQMSEKHCNFMINTGNAKAKDLIDLMNKVIDAVREKSGITLESELRIIGKE